MGKKIEEEKYALNCEVEWGIALNFNLVCEGKKGSNGLLDGKLMERGEGLGLVFFRGKDQKPFY